MGARTMHLPLPSIVIAKVRLLLRTSSYCIKSPSENYYTAFKSAAQIALQRLLLYNFYKQLRRVSDGYRFN
jgi:hypothetical protein